MKFDFNIKEVYNCDDLLKIMSILRSETGCPWDIEQTHLSLRKNLLEEAYEVAEAIDLASPVLLCEELGDLLLQVVFHSRIAEQKGDFSFINVTDGICKKLIHRHPHIFSDIIASDSETVLANWDSIKREEKGHKNYTDTLKSVPASLPALMKSAKVQSRAAKSGFDYPDADWAMKDLLSEIDELKEAILEKNEQNITEELGDLLFSIVNLSRFLKVDAEEALNKSCDKFIYRFEKVENLAISKNIDMKSSDINFLDKLWKEAKK